MISQDQPKIFTDKVIAAVSSLNDGNMKLGIGDNDQTIKNRGTFLNSLGIKLAQTTLIRLTYDTDNYAKYRIIQEIERASGMYSNESVEYADALVVTQPNHALFLPLADCVGAVLHDPANGALMVSHLGRHSVEINGATKSVNYLRRHFSSNPTDIKVWLSPGVGRDTYPLTKFDGQSLHEMITFQLLSAGIKPDNIERSAIDTAIDPAYYSHSEFLKGNQPGSERFAIVAMMKV